MATPIDESYLHCTAEFRHISVKVGLSLPLDVALFTCRFVCSTEPWIVLVTGPRNASGRWQLRRNLRLPCPNSADRPHRGAAEQAAFSAALALKLARYRSTNFVCR
jgi:hypothetical protein